MGEPVTLEQLDALRPILEDYIDAQSAHDRGCGTRRGFRNAEERLEFALARLGLNTPAELALRLIDVAGHLAEAALDEAKRASRAENEPRG